MPVSVEVTGLSEFVQKIEALQDALQNKSEVLTDIGNIVKQAAVDNFETEGSLLEYPWKPLSPFTIMERLHLGYGEGPILFRTGQLRDSFVITVGDSSVTVGNVAGAKYSYSQAEGPNQRIMLTLPQWLQDDVVTRVQEFVDDAITL